MSDSDKRPIIIIKKKGGHGDGHHGGSWKVAIADFAIAMMALFLVLWLLSITDDEQKQVISSYFETGQFSREGTTHPINLGGAPSKSQSLDKSGPNTRGNSGTEVVGDMESAQRGEKVDFKGLADELRKMVGTKNDEHVGGNVFVEVLPEGLRMVIMDNTEQPMFEKGGIQMTPFYEDLLINLGHVIRKSENPVVISGHTDGTPSKTFQYNNWNLSSDRALVAQKILSISGVPDEQFIMVSAMAGTEPRIRDKPLDVSNRRIELMVLDRAVAKKLKRMFGDTASQISISEDDLDEANQAAHKNQLPNMLVPE